MHQFIVCRDKAMFDTLQQEGNSRHINMESELKVEGMGSVWLRLHYGMVQTFHNARFVPHASANLISLGEITKIGLRYIGSGL